MDNLNIHHWQLFLMQLISSNKMLHSAPVCRESVFAMPFTVVVDLDFHETKQMKSD
jgi:hypothetical protein